MKQNSRKQERRRWLKPILAAWPRTAQAAIYIGVAIALWSLDRQALRFVIPQITYGQASCCNCS